MAEFFGRFPEWDTTMLVSGAWLAGSVPGLARIRLSDGARLCDLDDAHELLHWHLRPSEVVSRKYERTRAWARRIFDAGTFVGVRWWSYYDPQWTSLAVWDPSLLRLQTVEPVTLAHSALVEAGSTIGRRIVQR